MGRYLLTFCGLALCAGPLFAQDFIDLERERLQQQQDDIQVLEPLPEPATEAVDPVSQDANYGELYYQMQLLQQEVMELRGRLEEQTYELRQLKQQSLERYVDMDRRVSQGGGDSTGDPVTTRPRRSNPTAHRDPLRRRPPPEPPS
jgi:hypothetical protein